MRSRPPFESAASELVPESKHPLEQLPLLDERAQELGRGGDIDAVIECRIKQLCLHRVLVFLHEFPLKDFIRAQAVLAEAYAEGGYYKQAHEHLSQAKEACAKDIQDELQAQRLQADLLIAEGKALLAEDRLDAAKKSLTEAAKVVREVFGEATLRGAKIQNLLGQIAQRRKSYAEAIDHFAEAWEVHEQIDTADGEETMRLKLRIAEAKYADGRKEEAIEDQQEVVVNLRRTQLLPTVLVEALSQLARWLEGQGRQNDGEALKALQEAEKIVEELLDKEDPKAVEIKRDVALLFLKMGDHETALQYLQNVEYLERRLHGSQSANVARTLKALGTVHLVRHNVVEAEQCLLQALRIFEADYPPNTAIIRDIHAKLNSIAAAPQPQGR